MTRRHAFAVLVSLLAALPFAAQTTTAVTPALQPSDNPLLRGAAIVLGSVMIWTILYKAVYPYFLNYYRDEFCKTIFWNLLLLYTLTWIFVSLYVVLDIGFYWAWLPWLGLFLGVWWLISGTVLLLRRVPA
ncbi:MAG: hypothetical protein QOF63_3143 [Thermoanaerobaculia bacterium]|jgi:hypothetical protein|nr:hypothetical protein [Thermoanaerobaculia bacterium]